MIPAFVELLSSLTAGSVASQPHLCHARVKAERKCVSSVRFSESLCDFVVGVDALHVSVFLYFSLPLLHV